MWDKSNPTQFLPRASLIKHFLYSNESTLCGYKNDIRNLLEQIFSDGHGLKTLTLQCLRVRDASDIQDQLAPLHQAGRLGETIGEAEIGSSNPAIRNSCSGQPFIWTFEDHSIPYEDLRRHWRLRYCWRLTLKTTAEKGDVRTIDARKLA